MEKKFHEPIIEADPTDLSTQRDYWCNCAIGFILDYRKFSVGYLQHVLRSAWRLRGAVQVVGRGSHFYILHFAHMDELNHVCNEVPWSVDDAVLVMEKWRPNLVLGKLQLNYVSLCVQLHGLPLEYQYPELAEKMGQTMGIFERIDLDDRVPRNIGFMRIRVRVDPWASLLTGFMLRLDDGAYAWIQCRYERVHKICKRCGLIGHTRGQCTLSLDEVETSLYRQRMRIQRLHQVHFRFDTLEPLFTNDLRAYYNPRQGWTSQICFGPFTILTTLTTNTTPPTHMHTSLQPPPHMHCTTLITQTRIYPLYQEPIPVPTTTPLTTLKLNMHHSI